MLGKYSTELRSSCVDMNPRITTLLSTHRQLHCWSCSASAHEFLGKLHGKVGDSDSPLQNLSSSQKGGFQFESFLNSIGFTGKDSHELPKDAVTLLLAEVTQGRFPLVSVLAGVGTSSTDWHIVVAVPVNSGGVALVDPATQTVLASDSADTLRVFEQTTNAVPGRPKIHVLTYSTYKP